MVRALFFYTVINNRIGSAWVLSTYGANINIVDNYGGTPLYYAAYHCYSEMFKLLIEKRKLR